MIFVRTHLLSVQIWVLPEKKLPRIHHFSS